jgi:hypothetical protein
VRKRERESIYFKGMAGALALFSYLVFVYSIDNLKMVVNVFLYLRIFFCNVDHFLSCILSTSLLAFFATIVNYANKILTTL